MAKVKFKFSIKEITFEYEGDHDTGRAISESMHNTLGSLAQAQNAVIDVTPEERPALPAPPTPPARRRRPRLRTRPASNGDGAAPPSPGADGEPVQAKPSKSRRPRSEGFRAQMYRLATEGYLSVPRTAADIQAELAKRGFTFPMKNIASELTEFTKKGYLSREHNDEGKYAYVRGANNDLPGSFGGSPGA